MASATTGKKFRPSLWGTLGLVAGSIIFCSAGFWQLERAAAKRELFAAFEQGGGELLRGPVADGDAEQYLYRRMTLTGRYAADRQILLDNMMHNGRPGYQVLTPLRIGTTAVLINRGWLPADVDRSVMPEVRVAAKMRNVTGRLYRLPRPGYVLEPAALQPDAVWPRRLLYPTAAEIAGHLKFSVHNYQLLLDSTEADGYTREWRPALMPAEKHLAYAIQWFMMAGTIAIIYVVLTIRAARREKYHV